MKTRDPRLPTSHSHSHIHTTRGGGGARGGLVSSLNASWREEQAAAKAATITRNNNNASPKRNKTNSSPRRKNNMDDPLDNNLTLEKLSRSSRGVSTRGGGSTGSEPTEWSRNGDGIGSPHKINLSRKIRLQSIHQTVKDLSAESVTTDDSESELRAPGSSKRRPSGVKLVLKHMFPKQPSSQQPPSPSSLLPTAQQQRDNASKQKAAIKARLSEKKRDTAKVSQRGRSGNKSRSAHLATEVSSGDAAHATDMEVDSSDDVPLWGSSRHQLKAATNNNTTTTNKQQQRTRSTSEGVMGRIRSRRSEGSSRRERSRRHQGGGAEGSIRGRRTATMVTTTTENKPTVSASAHRRTTPPLAPFPKSSSAGSLGVVDETAAPDRTTPSQFLNTIVAEAKTAREQISKAKQQRDKDISARLILGGLDGVADINNTISPEVLFVVPDRCIAHRSTTAAATISATATTDRSERTRSTHDGSRSSHASSSSVGHGSHSLIMNDSDSEVSPKSQTAPKIQLRSNRGGSRGSDKTKETRQEARVARRSKSKGGDGITASKSERNRSVRTRSQQHPPPPPLQTRALAASVHLRRNHTADSTLSSGTTVTAKSMRETRTTGFGGNTMHRHKLEQPTAELLSEEEESTFENRLDGGIEAAKASLLESKEQGTMMMMDASGKAHSSSVRKVRRSSRTRSSKGGKASQKMGSMSERTNSTRRASSPARLIVEDKGRTDAAETTNHDDDKQHKRKHRKQRSKSLGRNEKKESSRRSKGADNINESAVAKGKDSHKKTEQSAHARNFVKASIKKKKKAHGTVDDKSEKRSIKRSISVPATRNTHATSKDASSKASTSRRSRQPIEQLPNLSNVNISIDQAAKRRERIHCDEQERSRSHHPRSIKVEEDALGAKTWHDSSGPSKKRPTSLPPGPRKKVDTVAADISNRSSRSNEFDPLDLNGIDLTSLGPQQVSSILANRILMRQNEESSAMKSNGTGDATSIAKKRCKSLHKRSTKKHAASASSLNDDKKQMEVKTKTDKDLFSQHGINVSADGQPKRKVRKSFTDSLCDLEDSDFDL